MQNFKNSEGWRIITERIEKMIEDYTASILSVNPEHNKIEFTRHDVLRLTREVLIVIRDEPERLIRGSSELLEKKFEEYRKSQT